MENVLLIRYGEIHLKGLNRPWFERLLLRRLKEALFGIECELSKGEGRFYVRSIEARAAGEAVERIKKVFGVHSVSLAACVDKDFETVAAAALAQAREHAARTGAKTFKVETKRADKRYPMRSMEISSEVGGYILERENGLKVDVLSPEMTVYIEIRENAYVYTGKEMGPGGMPVGSSGRAMTLLSGGIDSPVSSYMTAKRGVEIEAVHYHSFPYTGENARRKVIDLARLVSQYSGAITLHIVRFTEIQQEIYKKCPHEELTIIMRRYMMDIAQRLAKSRKCQALVTGESIGQVASQTIESLACTDAIVDMPVFRPLIGMDKDEIVAIANKIGTYETSILPYEDCCTVFVAKHPVTKPRLADIIKSEAALDREGLIAQALANTERLFVTSGGAPLALANEQNAE